MQLQTHDGGHTTTDEHVDHDPGCASVSHPGMTCENAMNAFKLGKFTGMTGRGFRPAVFRKAATGLR